MLDEMLGAFSHPRLLSLNFGYVGARCRKCLTKALNLSITGYIFWLHHSVTMSGCRRICKVSVFVGISGNVFLFWIESNHVQITKVLLIITALK